MTATLRANHQPCQNGLVLEDHPGGYRIKPPCFAYPALTTNDPCLPMARGWFVDEPVD